MNTSGAACWSKLLQTAPPQHSGRGSFLRGDDNTTMFLSWVVFVGVSACCFGFSVSILVPFDSFLHPHHHHDTNTTATTTSSSNLLFYQGPLTSRPLPWYSTVWLLQSPGLHRPSLPLDPGFPGAPETPGTPCWPTGPGGPILP